MRLIFINSATFSSQAIVRELNRIETIEHLEFLDHLPRSLVEGIPTRFHSLIALQQGEYPDVDWRDVPPLDHALLQAMAECETIFLKMVEKNGKFSKLLDLEGQRRRFGLPAIGTTATQTSYERRKALYLRHLRYWNHVIDAEQIDCVVITVIPQHGYDYVLYRLCRMKGIPVLFFDNLPFPGLILPKEQIDEPDTRIIAAYDRAKAKYRDGAIPLGPAVEKFYGDQTSTMRDPTPEYMDMSRIDQWEYTSIRSDWKTAKSFARDAASFVKNYILGGQRRDRARNLLHSWRLRYGKQQELNKLRAYYDTLIRLPDLDRPYIYLPLHYQPEISTSPLAGVFAEQILVAQMLSALVPHGWHIYVKEHPLQKSLTREASFYRDLSLLPNVTLVSRDFSTFKLIDSATAVATCTGRVGWEALFRGKPVLTFGEAPYAYADGAFRICTVEDCRRALDQIVTGSAKPTHRTMRLFLRAIEDVSCPGDASAISPAAVEAAARMSVDEVGISIARNAFERFRQARGEPTRDAVKTYA